MHPTTHKRDVMRSQRYTKAEDALMQKQAAAEGYSSVIEWQRDTLLAAAQGGDRVRAGMDRMAEVAGQGFESLALQIRDGSARQIERGLNDMRAAVRQGHDQAMQDAVRLAVAAAMNDVLMSHEALREDIQRNTQAIVDRAFGDNATPPAPPSDDDQLVQDMLRAGRAARTPTAGARAADLLRAMGTNDATAAATKDADQRLALAAAARLARAAGRGAVVE
ncbi:hypothetical protein [Burkholderia vietnamiensis]|jgi:hypothetical protein|uniref:hypothetical protein n=1 Tax=Burkholderia vietnamiensis TaxID=60552 RepID=UPI0010416910|nr:hypothetical protein [Burkholderia vietnamiensis]